jgi:hypothetical protein
MFPINTGGLVKILLFLIQKLLYRSNIHHKTYSYQVDHFFEVLEHTSFEKKF